MTVGHLECEKHGRVRERPTLSGMIWRGWTLR